MDSYDRWIFVWFGFVLLHACLDGRRGEFVRFVFYGCSGVGLFSSHGITVLFTLYKLRGDVLFTCYYSSRMWQRYMRM